MSNFRGASTLMLPLSAGSKEIEGREGSYSPVLIVRPRGHGGVATVIDAVEPHLGPNVEILRASVAKHPYDLAAVLTRARNSPVVHLHPSFRWRALLRDGALHRLIKAGGASTLVHWHGVDRALILRIDDDAQLRHLARTLVGDADHSFGLIPELQDAYARWGLGDLEIVRNPHPARVGPRAPVPRRILFLGRFVEDKGVHALVVALGLLRRTWPDATLVLAGRGPESMTGRGVRELGWIDEDRRQTELSRASVLVLPTRDDAAPMVVLEALAAGVPVVATRIGAIPEMIGEAGILIDQPDPASIARAIEAIWRDPPPRRRLDAYAPQAIAHHWSATYEALACRG
ncbi:MAG: glycosyltransferase family 4 protein [Myxococcota bacterium]